MRRFGAMLLVLGLMLSMVGCGSDKKEEKPKEPAEQSEQQDDIPTIKISKMTAEEVIRQFENGGYPINKVIVYDEETDVNGLLGRPNQYTSKINFADSRYKQYDIENNPVGGSVEVFDNAKNATVRRDYIDGISKTTGIFSEYLYLHDNILLRIHGQLTPSEAKEYEDGFNLLIEGKEPVFTGVDTSKELKDSGTFGMCDVAIKDFSIAKNKDNEDVIIINFDYTNNSNEAKSFNFAVHATVFQDGVSLDTAYETRDIPGYTDFTGGKEIKDGASITVQEAYILKNLESPVEVEVSEFLSEKNDKLVKVFEIRQ